MLPDLSRTACGIQLEGRYGVACNDSCSLVWLGVECEESNTVLSTIGLGLFDLLPKFHFLLVLQPTVVKLMQHLVCVWKQPAHVVYFTAEHCSLLCFALISPFLCGMLVRLLLLPILETQWYKIYLKITMLQAFFLYKCFLVLNNYWS